MTLYIAPEYRQLLEANQLSTFDSVWEYRASWFEEPNNRRGGWSGVGRIALKLIDGGEIGAYLKRQDNHGRWSFRHPIAGEPTFTREYKMLSYLGQRGVPTPKLLFFGQHLADGHHRAILLTEELEGYRPMDEVVDAMFANARPVLAEQNALLRAVAKTVRALHDTRIEHRALYPKHIFVKPGVSHEVALIDLEKARFNIFSVYSSYLDLAALTRHSDHWSRSRRMYFYKQYFGISKLGFWTRWLARQILKRSVRGKKTSKKHGKEAGEK